MSERVLLERPHIYVPIIAITRATLKHSWNKISVATATAPNHICGEARRIGYTGKDENDLALYRLKIRPGHGLSTVTLPAIYIIEDGIFQDYEDWKQQQT
jgi:hypothetical protein